MESYIVTDYLEDVLVPENFKKAANWTCAQIRKLSKKKQVESIAVRGASGTIMGGVISYKTGIPITLVRKKNEDSHSDYEIEGLRSGDYVIVDDQIETGDTIFNIIREIEQQSKYDQMDFGDSLRKCSGIILYSDYKLYGEVVETLSLILGSVARDIPIITRCGK